MMNDWKGRCSAGTSKVSEECDSTKYLVCNLQVYRPKLRDFP